MILENGQRAEPNGFFWEISRLKNEIMTADSGDLATAVVSDFTIALLNDTGWYTVTNYLRDTINWGRGKGCNFYEQACKLEFEEFCNNGDGI